MMNLQKIALVLTAAAAVTLGGCHVLKTQTTAKHATATVKVEVPVTLESLDVRVRDIENRMAAARAARAKAARAPQIIVR